MILEPWSSTGPRVPCTWPVRVESIILCKNMALHNVPIPTSHPSSMAGPYVGALPNALASRHLGSDDYCNVFGALENDNQKDVAREFMVFF